MKGSIDRFFQWLSCSRLGRSEHNCSIPPVRRPMMDQIASRKSPHSLFSVSNQEFDQDTGSLPYVQWGCAAKNGYNILDRPLVVLKFTHSTDLAIFFKLESHTVDKSTPIPGPINDFLRSINEYEMSE
jgi:hypothetical protein